MATFAYTAVDKRDAFVRGTVEERTLKRATAKLETEGLLVVNIRPEQRSRLSRLNHLLDTVGRLDKIFFTRHLYTMLESGIALDEAVKTTAEQTTHRKFQAALLDVHHQLQQGQSLHRCLGRHPRYFDEFYVSMVRVGEASGRLDEVLAYILEQQESDYELITKTRSAMIYPAVIVGALILMVVFMMAFVVPKITDILKQYEVTLPLATRALIGLSDFLMRYGLLLIPVLALLAYLFVIWKRSRRGRWQWDALVLKLPGIKQIVTEFNIARFTRSLSALLKSGLQIDHALELAAGISANSHYRKQIGDTVKFVRKGIPLAEVLKGQPKLFPQITTRMVEVGEQTGKLDHMLSRLATFYEKSLSATIGNISSVIEPTLLISIGLAVAFVAIAILTPIWSYSDSI